MQTNIYKCSSGMGDTISVRKDVDGEVELSLDLGRDTEEHFYLSREDVLNFIKDLQDAVS